MDTGARLLIVEDHPLYREGLVQVLASGARHLRCLTVGGAQDALRALRNHADIDLVVADHRLPGTDGLTLLREVGRLFPTVARVLISGADDARLPVAARDEGLSGYLPKTLEPQDLIDAIASILDGETWFPAVRRDGNGLRLTARQTQILERVAAGCGNKAIARELAISDRTVKYHLGQAMHSLSAATRAEAVARASALGLIDPARNPAPARRRA